MVELKLFRHAVLCLFITLPAYADPVNIQASSGPEKVAVLELYTSEGCSSCPPADEFVSRLGESEAYAGRVVPLAFHVTYWDYIGWKDPWADKAFDRRQRDIAHRQRSRSVYTPQLVLDGQDTRGSGRFVRQLQKLNTREPGADIALQARTGNGGRLLLDLDIALRDGVDPEPLVLHAVLFENDLNSRVEAGENHGKTLHHDFVVRKFEGPVDLPGGQRQSSHKLALSLPTDLNPDRAGIAVYVENSRTGEVLQALATPLIMTSAQP